VSLTAVAIKKGIRPSTLITSHAATISHRLPLDLHLLAHIDSSP
jgi:hypothetical protein